MPYTLELYFTGLCTFVPDEKAKECTVLLVDASDPEREFAGLLTARPNPHSPVLAVPLEYVVIDPKKYRTPIIVPDGAGKSVAIFDLDGEDLVLDVGKTDPDFAAVATHPNIYHPESFLWTLDLDEYGGKDSKGLKGDALDFEIPLPWYLATRLRCKNGSLSTHKLAVDQKGRLLPFEPRSVEPKVVVPGSKAIADYSVLSIDSLSAPVVEIRSKTKGTIGLTPKNGKITATLTNQDTSAEVNEYKIIDFLWYYKLMTYDHTMNYKEALVPWADPQHDTKITPSTSSCPPTRVKTKKTIHAQAFTAVSETTTELSPLEIALLPAAERATKANDADVADLVPSSGAQTFPDCVALVVDDSAQATAVVIHSRAVLTAGHEVSSAKSLAIRTGQDAFDPAAQTVRVVGDPILPDGFLEAHDCADLALLILDPDSVVSLTPQQISSVSINTGSQGTLVGFGRDTVQREPYGKKQRANLTVEEIPFNPPRDVTCTETFEFRAVRPSGVASHGDSGAPFYEERNGKFELVGLAVRTVMNEKTRQLEAVFLDLPKYHKWIEAELEKVGLKL